VPVPIEALPAPQAESAEPVDSDGEGA